MAVVKLVHTKVRKTCSVHVTHCADAKKGNDLKHRRQETKLLICIASLAPKILLLR